MIKSIIATASATGSYGVYALASDIGSLPMQLTALGFFGASVLYVIAKIVPEAMKQRQEETRAFITAVEKMTENHAQQLNNARIQADESIRRQSETARLERGDWLKTLDKQTSVLETIARKIEQCGVRPVDTPHRSQ